MRGEVSRVAQDARSRRCDKQALVHHDYHGNNQGERRLRGHRTFAAAKAQKSQEQRQQNDEARMQQPRGISGLLGVLPATGKRHGMQQRHKSKRHKQQ